MFENFMTSKGIHASRYIASWYRVGGVIHPLEGPGTFHDWLVSEGLTEDEIARIIEMAMCGKLELQFSAKQFLNNYRSLSVK